MGEVVRPATTDDLPALTDIYNHWIVHSVATFDVDPVTVADRARWFERFATTGRHRLLVADDDGALLGYACSAPHRDRAGYANSVETSAYLHPDAVGRRVGTRLYQRLLADLADEDVHRAYAGIALPNPGSVALHERLGYRHAGTFTEIGRKQGRWIDVAWYERAMS